MMMAFHAGNTATTGGVVNSDLLLPAGKVLRCILISIAAQINPATTGYHIAYAAIVQGGLFDTGTLGKNNVLGAVFVSGYRVAAGDVGFQSSEQICIPDIAIPLGSRPSLRLTSTCGNFQAIVVEATLYIDV